MDIGPVSVGIVNEGLRIGFDTGWMPWWGWILAANSVVGLARHYFRTIPRVRRWNAMTDEEFQAADNATSHFLHRRIGEEAVVIGWLWAAAVGLLPHVLMLLLSGAMFVSRRKKDAPWDKFGLSRLWVNHP